MMTLAAIEALSAEAAVKAAKRNKKPLVPRKSDVDRWRATQRCPIPNLGYLEPEGWERLPRTEWFFVDKSGLGDASEPALTIPQFFDAIERQLPKGYGYALVEEGQFQIYIAPFKRL